MTRREEKKKEEKKTKKERKKKRKKRSRHIKRTTFDGIISRIQSVRKVVFFRPSLISIPMGGFPVCVEHTRYYPHKKLTLKSNTAIIDPNTNLTLWESGAIIQYLILIQKGHGDEGEADELAGPDCPGYAGGC
jgi:hypothetical protein